MGPVRQTQSRELLLLFICVCSSLCTIVAHNTAQNRPDNFPSYPPDNHHCSDDVYLRKGGPPLTEYARWTLCGTKKQFGRDTIQDAINKEKKHCLMAFFPDNLGKPAPERLTQSEFQRSKRWWGGSGISWTICKSFAPHSTDNHASSISLNFVQAKCSSWCPTNNVKALKINNLYRNTKCITYINKWSK